MGAVLAAQACGPPPETTLEPVHRLLELRDDAHVPGIPGACGVDDEIRPALGCVPLLPVVIEHHLPRWDTALGRRYPLPPNLAARTFVVESAYHVERLNEPGDWTPLPPVLVRAPGAELALTVQPLPPDEGDVVDLDVHLRPVPPAEQRTTTHPVPIGRGAVLVLGLGLDPIAFGSGAAPVEFRLLAATDTGERELLRETLDPAEAADRRWHDHRLPLDDLAGRSVRFTFVTRVVPRPGDQPGAAFGFPLWGAPRVLEPRPRGEKPNVVLVSIDTLRADHVGAYGSDLPTTPEMDRVAAAGTLFERVFAPYPSTTASHASMLTGVYPAVHGVRGPLDQPIARALPFLAELLAPHGYQTAAVTEDGMIVPTLGFERGFDSYRENKGTSIWSASGQVDATFSAGLAWLEAHRGERFFLFLHTYQVHDPYRPPPEFDVFRTYRENGVERPIDADTKRAIRLRHLYAGEVRYTDSWVRRLLDGLAALGETERTIVILTADHGEEFDEHGWIGHGIDLYDEVLHVPLIMYAPGRIPAGLRIPVQASLIDLTPTILDLLHLPIPPLVQGVTLALLLRGSTPSALADRVVFAELRNNTLRQVAARTPALKWIFDEGPNPAVEVYDLPADAGERQPITRPELVAQGQALVHQYREQSGAIAARVADQGGGGSAGPPPTLDQRTLEKLRALGYVQ